MTFSMLRSQKRTFVAAVGLSVMALAGGAIAAEPDTNGVEAVFHRLSADQYKQVIADIFGPTIKVAGRFEPDNRAEGLLAVGSSKISVTATGFQQYDSMARGIANQVVSAQHRG